MATTVIDTLVTNLFYHTDMTSVRRAQAQLTKVRQGLTSLSNQFFAMGAGATAGLGIAIKKSAELDESLRKLKSRANLTDAELAKSKEIAIQVSTDLPKDAQEVVDAMTQFVALGLDIEEAWDLAAPATLGSIASGESVQDVARWATGIRNIYKIPVEQMGEVIDQMAIIEDNSGAAFGQLGRALEHSLQSFKDADEPLESFFALMGTAADAMKDPSATSQGFALVLGNVAKASTKMGRGSKMIIDAFTNIGIAQEEMIAAREKGGLRELFGLIQERLPSQDHLTAFMTQIGGTTYAAALSNIVQNLEKVDRLTALQQGPHLGTGQRKADTMQEGLSGSFKVIAAQWDTLVNRIADSGLADWVEENIRGLAGFFGWLTETRKEVDEFGNEVDVLVRGGMLNFIGIVLAAGPALLALGAGIRAVAWAIGGFQVVLSAVSWLMGVWNASLIGTRIGLALLAIQQGITTAVTWLFNAALWANPLTWVVAAVVALIAGLAALFIWWDEISAFLWRVFGPAIKWIWSIMKPYIDLLKAVFVPVLRTIWDILKPIVKLFNNLAGLLKSALKFAGNLVPDWLKNMFGGKKVEGEVTVTEQATQTVEGEPFIQEPTALSNEELAMLGDDIVMPQRTTEATIITFPDQAPTTDIEGARATPQGLLGETITLPDQVPATVTEAGAEGAQITQEPTVLNNEQLAILGGNVTLPDQLPATGTDGARVLPQVLPENLIPGLQQPLPVAPQEAVQNFNQPQFAGAPGNTYNINLDNITINAQTAEARELAQNVGRELRDQLQTAVEAADSPIKR